MKVFFSPELRDYLCQNGRVSCTEFARLNTSKWKSFLTEIARLFTSKWKAFLHRICAIIYVKMNGFPGHKTRDYLRQNRRYFFTQIAEYLRQNERLSCTQSVRLLTSKWKFFSHRNSAITYVKAKGFLGHKTRDHLRQSERLSCTKIAPLLTWESNTFFTHIARLRTSQWKALPTQTARLLTSK